MMKILISFLFGVGVGISGTFLHNGYRPFGLLISLIAIAYGAHLMREMHQSRSVNLLYSLGWLLVIVRASSSGNGGELLIQANGYGNAFVIIGLGLILVMSFRRNRLK